MGSFILIFILANCNHLVSRAELNIAYDNKNPLNKLNSVIYINRKSLENNLDNRNMLDYIEDALRNSGFKVTNDRQHSNLVLNVKKEISKKVINYLGYFTEEQTIEKTVYNKEKDIHEKLPTKIVTRKPLPMQMNYDIYLITLTFEKSGLDIAKASIEVEEKDFQSNPNLYISKLIENISLNKELKNKNLICFNFNFFEKNKKLDIGKN